ncbi:MAG TPA: cyclic nucleotide-binding domain-containing protein [bacterium]
MSTENASQNFFDDIRRLRECLQGTLFLDRLKMPELEKLMSAMKKQRVPAGRPVFKQGDKADTFYLVSGGRLSFWVQKGGVNQKVADLKPKDYFGETALISDEPRSATVKAETDCDLFILRKEDFKEILMANPWIAKEIEANIAHKAKIKKKP